MSLAMSFILNLKVINLKGIAIVGLAAFLSDAAQASSYWQGFGKGFSTGVPMTLDSGEITGAFARQQFDLVMQKRKDVQRKFERQSYQSSSGSSVPQASVSTPTSGETKESGTIERLLKSADLKYTVTLRILDMLRSRCTNR